MTIQEVRAALADHRDELAELGVERLQVFGSVARGEGGPHSDVDFLVEMRRPAGLFKLARLRLALCDWLGCEVDLGTPASLRAEIRDDVLAEAIDAA